jgi:O-antigen ligase
VDGARRQEPAQLTALSAHPVDLEPSLVGERMYATRRRYTRVNVTVMLSVTVCLLYLFPAGMIVPSMTYVGRPALVMALLMWCWWLLVRLNPRLVLVGPQPLRWAAFGYLLALLLSYTAGLLRGLTGLEMNGQDLAVLATFEFLGVVLMMADGLPNWERLKVVLRVFVGCAAFMSLIGLLQFAFKDDYTRYLLIPGLQLKGGLPGFTDRGEGGLFRVAGTAYHYIEYSTCLAMALPFAIHFARFAPMRRQRQLFGLCGLVAVAGIPVALSRTGMLALAAVLLVMVPAWNWRTRYNIFVIGLTLTAAFTVVKPGLLGTLRSMFTGASQDPSIQGRTQDYQFVAHWFSQRPWLGRGPGTLIPVLNQGLVLDNEWLYTLVTGGIIGVAALAAIHITSITLAATAAVRSKNSEERHLCIALVSSQLIGILVAGTFDSLGFTTYAITLALLTGATGAVWRFTHPARQVRTSSSRRFDF